MEDNKDLYQLIEQQARMIAELKQTVEQMRQHPEAINVKDLSTYYQNQYLLLFDEITTPRWDNLKSEIEAINNELKLIGDKTALRKAQEQANQAIYDQIKAKEDSIHNEYINLEKIRFDTEARIDQLQKERLELTEKDQAKWLRLSGSIDGARKGVVPFVTMMNDVSTMVSHAIATGNVDSEVLRKIDETIIDLQATLQDATKHCQIEVLNIEKAIEELKHELQDLTDTSLEDQISVLENTLAKKEKYFNDLYASLDTLKQEHLHYIANLLVRAEVIGETPKEIAQNMEQFFAQVKTVLSEHDTVEIIEERELARQKRLVEISETRKAKIIELETLENDYHHLCGLYTTVKQNLQKIEDFIAKTQQTIKGSSAFSSYYQNWLAIKRSLSSANEAIGLKTKRLEACLAKRRLLVYDPFAKESLLALDKEIKGLKTESEELNSEASELGEKALQLQEANPKLASLITDLEKYENHLPSIYQQLQDLKQVIDEKHQIIITLKQTIEELEKTGDLLNENHLE